MFNSPNLSPQQVIASTQQGLTVIRSAMNVAGDMYAWSSGIAPADLTGIGMDSGDAAAILSAIADAYGLNRHYNAGVADGTYPSGYIFGASQRIVIGSRPS